ncbi:hypothetical protein TRFO_13713 [Tritrichomonas foetus]|uniref:EML-like first beta-propeller domain-containing protein n=1 Tax=Tritrichomonas foetus TaxID=1144522 RepID=A0A1J4L1W2_9EUKA|nr:hypothetical protein TRFO_13713 [Tritrichomonas foetus]|eukprot:OHT15877.1 hypothetical protein TRFO_13713 [Tritrichomonas foetus]
METANGNGANNPSGSVDDSQSHLRPSFFYDDEELYNQSAAHSSFDESFSLYHCFGFDLSRRYNAIPLNETTICITDGNFAFFLDLITGSEEIIRGHNAGIQCCAIHPNKEYVALGESGKNPKVLIYHFPSKKLYRILKGGTDSAFTALNFSPDGNMLACVGTFPDYTMTVWDWEKETLILRAKAFSQDIFRVTFSDKLAGRLVSSGVGHIRFWEMAKTFTGLKLQGEIGKFGNIEISDTAGYAIFPDGKVLSGAESGSLLLWEDALVKCEFDRPNGKKCHKGMVEVVFLKGHDVISAGRDGVIRKWDFTTIDTAETEDTSIPIDLNMKSKIRIAKDASIRCMYPLGSEYLIVDANNGLWKADIDNKNVQIIQKYHSGAIRAAGFSPNAPLFVTGGDDGYIRLWNITDKSLLSELKFNSPITTIVWVPLSTDSEGITIYVGFGDGCFRILLCTANGLVLKQPLKPHVSAVRDIVLSPSTKMVATTGDDGALFFFKFDEPSDLQPIGFVYVNGKKPRTKEEITQAAIKGITLEDDKDYAKGLSIRWNSDMASVECSDGTVASVVQPTGRNESSNESYYLQIHVDIMKSGTKDPDITAVLHCDDGEIYGRSDGSLSSTSYSKKLHSSAITVIAATPDKSWMLTASDNGEIFLFQQTTVRVRELPPPQLKEIEAPKVEDIKEGDYSIEEEKQKSELDRRIMSADEKKEIIKKKIDNLRNEFSLLVQKNAKAPSYMRLKDDEFKIDPFLFDLMKENTEKLVKDASTSTMWAAEKSRVALRKVKDRLVRNMTEEPFTVYGIKKDVCVSSFRMTALDPEVEKYFAEEAQKEPVDTNSSEHEDETAATESTTVAESDTAPSVHSTTSDRRRRRVGRFGQKAPLKKIVHTPDEHTQMKKKRDERKRKIMEQKPPSDYCDPDDVRAIDIAAKTIGDYKLKDYPHYIAPEEERMNANKKRVQLLKVQNAISTLKENFNNKLVDLRNLKERLNKTISETNRELAEIELSIGGSGEEYIIDKRIDKNIPIDMRDKIDIVLPTPEAINFADQVAAAAKRRLEAQAGKQKQSQQPVRRGGNQRKQSVKVSKKKGEVKDNSTEVEILERNQMKEELEYKRQILVKNIENGIKKFDEKVQQAADEKVRVHSEIVLAELRFLMMLREFKLLSKLELKDHELNMKLKQRKHDMDSIDNEVQAHEKQLKESEHEVEEAQKQLKKMSRNFEHLVDSSLKYHDQLQKIFNYNIRKNANKNEGDEIEVDISTLDVEAVKKMFEAQSMEKEEDACPAGCDQALYEKVLDLRESKMDIVDKINAAQQLKEHIKQQTNSILFKKTGLKTQFDQISKEFDDFQHEKQRRLNELNFSLSLQFHQIQFLESNEVVKDDSRASQVVKSMPADLSKALVFLSSGLTKLQQQEQNLKAERITLKQILESNHTKQDADEDIKSSLTKDITIMQNKVIKSQQMKFGQLVDLVLLEQLRVNKEADVLKDQIKRIDKEQYDEMKEVTDQIALWTDEMTAEVQRNTALLGNLANLTQQQRDIESVLQNSRTTQSADDLNQDLGLADPDELLADVEKNNELIDALNEEKTLLRRK